MPAIAHAQSIGRPYAHQSTQILYMQSQRGQSFSTYAQRGGQAKAYTMRARGGGGLAHGSTYAKTSLFARILLSFLFYKTFSMTIFLSLKCFSVYFSMELFNGYLKTSR